MNNRGVLLCLCIGCLVLWIQYRQNGQLETTVKQLMDERVFAMTSLKQLESTVKQLMDERVFAMTSLYGAYATFHGDASTMCTTVLETIDPIMERVCEQRQVLRMAWKELCTYQQTFQKIKDNPCLGKCMVDL